ncbi:MAG: ABC-type transport auxiliary lipoprotein family protein [Desulfarculaceae bacterium]|nr:ABC-type transport auxiliary lipoprotein family protein [Desulfarculaceae bacterium]MCF8073873.1 ABC-type transport auxiliary lipoprotein family protein [Desulfarculaceae bacterium]MCF8102853.1 ABC-type transport auxiliary lipoprotein family protein [Desulfarculaceae bacterium]MCF8116297.1 ABC-type transport auxiliary lipoprotein family protein [Desulfarculaceae bacterium]
MTLTAKRASGLAGLFLAVVMLLAAACGGSPQPYVYHYVLGYPPPGAVAASQKLDAAIKVERLGSLPLINNQSMLEIMDGREVVKIHNHRWQSYPADMVSSLLSRDMQAAQRYKAVFGPDSSQLPRFRLEGGVVQFLQIKDKAGDKAVLRLQLTLMDNHQTNVLKQVMFQKGYAHSTPLTGKGGAALAQAMSQAMAVISPQVRADMAQAIAERLVEPEPKKKLGSK